MHIDLTDNVTRILVQEYLNAIVNYRSQAELNYDVHKLIHTFEVVKMTDEILDYAGNTVSDEMKEVIRRSALLHDIGRCHEFKNGFYVSGMDHGQVGADLIQQYLPDLKTEIQTTKWHNKMPSDMDPPQIQPVLNYVRDADMLGNVRYEIKNMDVFIVHLLDCYPESMRYPIIDEEVIRAVSEKRNTQYDKIQSWSFLTEFCNHILWFFNLRTDAAKKLACDKRFFPLLRDTISEKVFTYLYGTVAEKEKIKQLFLNLFSDSFFDERMKDGI